MQKPKEIYFSYFFILSNIIVFISFLILELGCFFNIRKEEEEEEEEEEERTESEKKENILTPFFF